MLSPTCPLTKKEKLYVILHHECKRCLNEKCVTDCTFFIKPNYDAGIIYCPYIPVYTMKDSWWKKC